jgi:hypothetical protein
VQSFYRSFVREEDGAWRCIATAELQLPGGRIQVAVGTRFTRGARYMGIDVARLLEEYERYRPAS